MPARHKVLLLDDDPDLLELYRDMLARLPSQPDIHTATSGARAIALLESETFTLLISDLNMPKMDGLQVLTIVRRKFPHLRTAVMTSVVDEQFRTRAYAMGVDLFLEKPNTSQEINFFLDCIESLLGRESVGGFRGVQSKSLVDIIQLECLSQSSSVLKITNGQIEGKLWILDGNIIDAAVGDLSGEQAVQKILAWRSGNFEVLPSEPTRERRIFTSYQGLLLEVSQAIDEAKGAGEAEEAAAAAAGREPTTKLGELARFGGVEFLLAVVHSQKGAKAETWGVENPEKLGAWTQDMMQRFRTLGENLQAGVLNRVEVTGPDRYVLFATQDDKDLCVGFHRSQSLSIVRETMKQVFAQWVS